MSEAGAGEVSWAMRVPLLRARGLAGLRGRPGTEAALEKGGEEGSVWVRGRGRDGAVWAAPFERCHRWEESTGLLFSWTGSLPEARLPELTWRPLEEVLKPGPAELAMPGEAPAGVELVLVKDLGGGRDQGKCRAILTSVSEWERFCGEAMEARLERLQFAVSDRGEVLVKGEPLPAVRGRPLVEEGGVAVPAGYRWEPALAAAVVARHLRVSRGGLVLGREDGTWERIEAEDFLPATRSAARETAGHGS